MTACKTLLLLRAAAAAAVASAIVLGWPGRMKAAAGFRLYRKRDKRQREKKKKMARLLA